ncbi:MAG: 2-oxo-4-hydroxy-4-carboxy-5-ureidoimidazoline decarboxylase [Pseudomonadota bacterium]
MITLTELNTLPAAHFVATLGGIFEHSPWVAEVAASARPFADIAALHRAMSDAVDAAGDAAQLQLIRAHPELASRAAMAGDLTEASNREQGGAGLKSLTRTQFEQLMRLNNDYGARFGFPFILAVKGHNPDSIIAALGARIEHSPEEEQRTALEQIGRIARFRLEDLVADDIGNEILARSDELAEFSDQSDGLTCAYLTLAHRATAKLLRDYMLAAGLDAHVDDVGNVVGRLESRTRGAKTLLTGSHYDTVASAGRYDGRLGILLPIGVAARLKREGVELPFHVEIIGFSEEEGLRFQSTFLGSSAVAGCFDLQLLDRVDREGTSMRAALVDAGHDPAKIPGIARDPAQVAGYVEVHIEQGPVLLDAGLAVGVVTGVAGSRRSLVEIEGLAGHAGTVPMPLRRDAAAGAAEIVLAVEGFRARSRHRRHGRTAAGTQRRNQCHSRPRDALHRPAFRGRCIARQYCRKDRRWHRHHRDPAQARHQADHGARCRRSSVHASAATAVRRQHRAHHRQGGAVAAQRRRPRHMMMARLTDVGMLFVRCGNGGISHHPAESLDAADARLAADVFRDFLLHYKAS